jgi:DNA-binding MarR family transcriptional regulator
LEFLKESMPEQLTREELQALAIDTRQDIVKLLSKRPHTQSELAKKLGKHVTTVAEHTQKLEKSGLIERRDDGHKWVYFRLSRKGEKLFAPKFYSWTILLTLSIVSIAIGGTLGGALTLPRFAAEGIRAVPQQEVAVGAEIGAAPPESAGLEMPPTFGFSPIALVLVAVGIVGVVWALKKKEKERVLLIRRLS